MSDDSEADDDLDEISDRETENYSDTAQNGNINSEIEISEIPVMLMDIKRVVSTKRKIVKFFRKSAV